jgi:hypothetical protein
MNRIAANYSQPLAIVQRAQKPTPLAAMATKDQSARRFSGEQLLEVGNGDVNFWSRKNAVQVSGRQVLFTCDHFGKFAVIMNILLMFGL